MKIKTKSFDNHGQLDEYINKNKIKQKNIQQIFVDQYFIFLSYWE